MNKFLLQIGLFTLLFLSSQKINAQYTSVFGTNHTSWNVFTIQFPFEMIDSFVVSGDTVIQGTNWKKINSYLFTGGGYLSQTDDYFVREDTVAGKVWAMWHPPYEQLVADYSLSVGDSISYLSQYFHVDSIYYVAGEKYLRLGDYDIWNSSINEKLTMIEGIGTSFGIAWPAYDNAMYLICSFKDSSVAYHGTDPEYYFGECSYPTVGREREINRITELIVYPNPAHSAIHVQLSEISTVAELSIIDASGRVLQSGFAQTKSEYVVDLEKFFPGLYLVRLKKENGGFLETRFVVD